MGFENSFGSYRDRLLVGGAGETTQSQLSWLRCDMRKGQPKAGREWISGTIRWVKKAENSDHSSHRSAWSYPQAHLIVPDYSLNGLGTNKKPSGNQIGSLSHTVSQDKFQMDERFKG